MSFNKRAGRKGQRKDHKWNNRLALCGPSIGFCVCLCGEIIKWKDRMNLNKHILTMRSSWGNPRLLQLILYLFIRACVPWVGVGALINTAWPEDHETKACRKTLSNFSFSLLSSLLVSIFASSPTQGSLEPPLPDTGSGIPVFPEPYESRTPTKTYMGYCAAIFHWFLHSLV